MLLLPLNSFLGVNEGPRNSRCAGGWWKSAAVMALRLFLLISLLLLTEAQKWPMSGDCQPCRCYYQMTSFGRLRTVNCSRRGLSVIPANLPKDLMALDLSWNSLDVKQLREELCKFKSLQSLSLTFADLTTLSDILRDCSSVLELNLTGNRLAKIDSKTFQGLKNLHRLLGLEVESVVSREVFKHLTNLKILDLIFHGEILPKGLFDDMPIESLNLVVTQASRLPKGLLQFGLKTLNTLQLIGEHVRELKEGLLDGLSVLRKLFLVMPAVQKLPEHFFHSQQLDRQSQTMVRFANLQEVEISGVQTLPDMLFSQLTNLETLQLKAIRTFPQKGFLAGAINLRMLEITGSKLTHVPAGWFDKLYSLKTLKLSGLQLESLPEDVFKGLLSLNFLDLSFNSLQAVTGKTLSHLSKTLETLILRGNLLTEISKDCMSGLRSLRFLDISENHLANVYTSSFMGMSYMSVLYLNNNRLTSLPKDLFRDSIQLQSLSLADNYLVEFPQAVLQLKGSLINLDLASNELREVPGSQLCQFKYLESVILTGNYLRCDCPLLAVTLCPETRVDGQCNTPQEYTDKNLNEIEMPQSCKISIKQTSVLQPGNTSVLSQSAVAVAHKVQPVNNSALSQSAVAIAHKVQPGNNSALSQSVVAAAHKVQPGNNSALSQSAVAVAHKVQPTPGTVLVDVMTGLKKEIQNEDLHQKSLKQNRTNLQSSSAQSELLPTENITIIRKLFTEVITRTNQSANETVTDLWASPKQPPENQQLSDVHSTVQNGTDQTWTGMDKMQVDMSKNKTRAAAAVAQPDQDHLTAVTGLQVHSTMTTFSPAADKRGTVETDTLPHKQTPTNYPDPDNKPLTASVVKSSVESTNVEPSRKTSSDTFPAQHPQPGTAEQTSGSEQQTLASTPGTAIIAQRSSTNNMAHTYSSAQSFTTHQTNMAGQVRNISLLPQGGRASNHLQLQKEKVAETNRSDTGKSQTSKEQSSKPENVQQPREKVADLMQMSQDEAVEKEAHSNTTVNSGGDTESNRTRVSQLYQQRASQSDGAKDIIMSASRSNKTVTPTVKLPMVEKVSWTELSLDAVSDNVSASRLRPESAKSPTLVPESITTALDNNQHMMMGEAPVPDTDKLSNDSSTLQNGANIKSLQSLKRMGSPEGGSGQHKNLTQLSFESPNSSTPSSTGSQQPFVATEEGDHGQSAGKESSSAQFSQHRTPPGSVQISQQDMEIKSQQNGSGNSFIGPPSEQNGGTGESLGKEIKQQPKGQEIGNSDNDEERQEKMAFNFTISALAALVIFGCAVLVIYALRRWQQKGSYIISTQDSEDNQMYSMERGIVEDASELHLGLQKWPALEDTPVQC